jgi:release factor glutamine methyltransferase
LHDDWASFYRLNQHHLERAYPGLSLTIFLRDLIDILRFQSGHQLLELDHASITVSASHQESIKHRLLLGVPLQLLMGFVDFYYSRFYVNENVLIPRPETEYLVDMVVRQHRGEINRFLDVGTGSGVIALSLLQQGVGKCAVGVDISLLALEVATLNRLRMRQGSNLELLLSDRLENVHGTFDLIVSNPPYIKLHSHRSLVQPEVHAHEPHEALYLKDDHYYLWFEEFFLQVREHLQGLFYMEGHELELNTLAIKLEELKFQDVQILNDLTGRPRYLRASYLPT